jgi:hypothetical protein
MRESVPVACNEERSMRDAGGMSPGAPKGNENALKDGRYTADAIARRRSIAELVRTARKLIDIGLAVGRRVEILRLHGGIGRDSPRGHRHSIASLDTAAETLRTPATSSSMWRQDTVGKTMSVARGDCALSQSWPRVRNAYCNRTPAAAFLG